MSLMATTVSSFLWRSSSVRRTKRPMRPKPLIAIFVAMLILLLDAPRQIGGQILIAVAKLVPAHRNVAPMTRPAPAAGAFRRRESLLSPGGSCIRARSCKTACSMSTERTRVLPVVGILQAGEVEIFELAVDQSRPARR